jgi:putative redox protein
MTVEAHLYRPHGSLTTLVNGRHAWAADVDHSDPPQAFAPTPHDLLDSALAACTALTLDGYIRRHDMAVTALRIQIDREERVEAGGSRKYHLQRTLHIDGDLSDAERESLQAIAQRCPIHRVLTGEVQIETASAPPTPSEAPD